MNGINSSGQLNRILKIAGWALAGIMGITSVVFEIMLINFKLIPEKYCIIAGVVLVILVAVSALLQRWKIAGIITKVMSIFFTVVLIIGCVYIGQASKTLSKVTTTHEEKVVMGVYVLKDSGVTDIAQLDGGEIGIVADADRESTDELINRMKNDGFSAEYNEYDNTAEMLAAMEDNQNMGIILKTSSIDMLSDIEGYSDIAERLLLLYSGEFTINIEDNQTVEEAQDREYLSSEDVVAVYISGIDSRGSINEVSRSDVNILMLINKKTHSILMVNTPRDYYVPLSISGGVKDKLTHAGVYGIQCSTDTISMLYGINIDYYVKINFSGFENIINALGGVDVTLDYSLTIGNGAFTVHPGVNHLNGTQALAFSRERKAYADGDRQRGRNQMMIMEAAIKKACTPAILSNYSSVLSAVSDSVITNMSYDDLATLAQMQLSEMPSWNVKQISVTGSGSMSTTTYSMLGWNLYVMVPDESSMNNAMNEIRALYGE